MSLNIFWNYARQCMKFIGCLSLILSLQSAYHMVYQDYSSHFICEPLTSQPLNNSRTMMIGAWNMENYSQSSLSISRTIIFRSIGTCGNMDLFQRETSIQYGKGRR